MVIELAVHIVPNARDERQVGQAVGRRLWFCAGNRPGAVDLRKNSQVGRFLEEVYLNLVDLELNVNVDIFIVDDDQVTGMEILDEREPQGALFAFN